MVAADNLSAATKHHKHKCLKNGTTIKKSTPASSNLPPASPNLLQILLRTAGLDRKSGSVVVMVFSSLLKVIERGGEAGRGGGGGGAGGGGGGGAGRGHGGVDVSIAVTLAQCL